VRKLLLLLLLLAMPFKSAFAQFQNIVIIVQENRSTDNLFGASGLPGGDLKTNVQGKGTTLASSQDNPHTYQIFLQEVAGTYPPHAYNYVLRGAQPYWDLATQYGFANRMFQTDQGPSFPSHQFLVSGSSAPTDSSDGLVFTDGEWGIPDCKGGTGSYVGVLYPDGSQGTVFPCFTRSSLMDLLVGAGLSWTYYACTGKVIWDAPLALQNYYTSQYNVLNPPQVLTDIQNGRLANVSWVTPCGAYSDHPLGNTGGGPAWVASIVNAIGQSPYWQNTAILLTWDDWGGFWDHVPPLGNQTGWCENFCYGFRVPLIVISAVTPAGYVDNNPHDFGSILRFVETNFGLGQIGPGTYADAYSDDLQDFFTLGTPRQFVPIHEAPALTKKQLEDRSDPDTY
jgi:phospholipase C